MRYFDFVSNEMIVMDHGRYARMLLDDRCVQIYKRQFCKTFNMSNEGMGKDADGS